MELGVVGAGFGRTGTLSLKLALEQIGFGPCYHQLEAWNRPAHRGAWTRAVDGEPVDWVQLLAGFGATTDWPACSFWRPIREAHPGARVVLLTRDPDAWYDSISGTIFEFLERTPPDEPSIAWRDTMRRLIVDQDLGGRTDRAGATQAFRAYEADVRTTVPAGELLTYQVVQGWEPLCRFLGVEVPPARFPRTNSTAEFRDFYQIGTSRRARGGHPERTPRGSE